MRKDHHSIPATLALVLGLLLPVHDLQGQVLQRLRNAAARSAERELANQIEKLVRDAVRCAVGDSACADNAKASGKEVIYTDGAGEIIKDEKGVPITDPAKAAAQAEGSLGRPGEGVWANYDFIPGDKVLFYDDYMDDRVGDPPRRMEFVGGNWEVVEWQGRRLLRGHGPRSAALKIPLPKVFPERFTIEFDAHYTNWTSKVLMALSGPGGAWNSIEGHFFEINPYATGVNINGSGSTSMNPARDLEKIILPVRIHVDGSFAKVYVKERRVANIPNAQFKRSNELYLVDAGGANPDHPIYFGPIRIAEGGGDLYRRLVDEGRVTTQGILFAVNSDRLLPESTPTLGEIGDMLKQNPSLRIRIEGHTDSTGEPQQNMDLSRRRAESVRNYLVQKFSISPNRLETEGFGQTRPADDNATSEGRQNNRRVELVRLGS